MVDDGDIETRYALQHLPLGIRADRRQPVGPAVGPAGKPTVPAVERLDGAGADGGNEERPPDADEREGGDETIGVAIERVDDFGAPKLRTDIRQGEQE